ncbi:MAG: hypothetical protein Ct9H300mP12_13280 [Acidimicrobiales bacterium]|nr:MAG: hypothetical protein Ct9H300mP12_13280 [Acidimicrobiales bacterium]
MASDHQEDAETEQFGLGECTPIDLQKEQVRYETGAAGGAAPTQICLEVLSRSKIASIASWGICIDPSSRTRIWSETSRRNGRSASESPNTGEMTSIGKGEVMSVTRSASPLR